MSQAISGLGLPAERYLAGEGQNSKATVAELATEFESLLLANMLKTMRESTSEGWFGTGDDQAGAVMVEVAEQQLARVLAAHGGLGLGGRITSDLAAAAERESSEEKTLPSMADKNSSDGS